MKTKQIIRSQGEKIKNLMYDNEMDGQGRMKVGFKKDEIEKPKKEGVIIDKNDDLERRSVVKDEGKGEIKVARWGKK